MPFKDAVTVQRPNLSRYISEQLLLKIRIMHCSPAQHRGGVVGVQFSTLQVVLLSIIQDSRVAALVVCVTNFEGHLKKEH